MNYNARAQLLFRSSNLLFRDVAVEIFLGPVHLYPDIFESATFSFRTQNFPCPHVIGFVLDSTLESGFKNIRIHCVWMEAVPEQKIAAGLKNIRTRVDGALNTCSVRRPRSHYQSRPFLPDMTDCEVIERFPSSLEHEYSGSLRN